MRSFFQLTLLSLTVCTVLVQAGPTAYEEDQLRVFSEPTAELRLVQYGDDTPARWMTEADKEALLRAGVHFMDITDHQHTSFRVADQWTPFIPSRTKYNDEVAPFIADLSTVPMRKFLTQFTSFRNRYYKSEYGAASSRWLLDQVKSVASRADHVTVSSFAHKWSQSSVIARFEGSNKALEKELVIVGAHQDSLNMWLPYNGRAPGADDDGSGSTSIFEAFRSLVDNGFKPERSVEFHWYSAEEGGLLGSQDVAYSYKAQGKRVVSMLQNDMTGYVGTNEEVIGIITDHVDEDLTDFLKVLVNNYASIPYVLTKCGYACSDHASWREVGFPSAFQIESTFDDSNKMIHGSGDTIDRLSFNHMMEFSKVAIGYAIELSHERSD
ncbi:hypothetical protein BDF14DRAFT_1736247 [Spinellus fusiger]|nr:hypothetical protein BDF14DRAFT_1736247 [Spinellus fusiger]